MTTSVLILSNALRRCAEASANGRLGRPLTRQSRVHRPHDCDRPTKQDGNVKQIMLIRVILHLHCPLSIFDGTVATHHSQAIRLLLESIVRAKKGVGRAPFFADLSCVIECFPDLAREHPALFLDLITSMPLDRVPELLEDCDKSVRYYVYVGQPDARDA